MAVSRESQPLAQQAVFVSSAGFNENNPWWWQMLPNGPNYPKNSFAPTGEVAESNRGSEVVFGTVGVW